MKNEVLDVIMKRKSVRVFTDEEICVDDKNAIIDAAIQAPTAGNMSLFTIIDIQDQEIKDKLAISCDNQPFIKTAKMVLIFVADYKKWSDSFQMYYPGCRKPGLGDFNIAINDALLAAQNAVIAAESLGIGSCYIGDIIERYDYHKELLNIPQYAVPVTMLVFGHPAQSQISRKQTRRYRREDMVSVNTYVDYNEEMLKEMFDAKAIKDGRDGKSLVDNIYRRKWSQPFIKDMSVSMQKWLANFEIETED